MADKRRNLGIPSGVVFPFAGSTAPYGYLVCDGSAISRSDYPSLFAALGTSHGQGDGSTTFNLPDYRGRFMRGVDGVAGNDPNNTSRTASATGGNTGNAVGSVQQDAIQNIVGDIIDVGNRHTRDVANGPFDIVTTTNGYVGEYGATSNYRKINFDASRVARTSTESRPKNVNVNYIIKV
jgi:microcystin-dependent protein